MKTCMCYCFKPIYTLCVCMVLVKLACHTLIYCAFSLACRHVYSLYDNCLSQQLLQPAQDSQREVAAPTEGDQVFAQETLEAPGAEVEQFVADIAASLAGSEKKILIRHLLQCLFLHPQYLLCLHLHPNWRRIPFVDLILW